jgi:hypothetical protein
MMKVFLSRSGDSVGGGVVVGGRVVVWTVVWTVVCLVVVEPDGFVVAESDAKAKKKGEKNTSSINTLVLKCTGKSLSNSVIKF